jgi:hypothetical protein
MADLQKILNKFNDLGIENKGLVPDAPTKPSSSNTQDPVKTAQMLNEGLNGKHIPGVSDIASNDMAALAGIDKPQQRPQPANPNPNSMHIASNQSTDKWSEVDARLSNIESKLNTIFESIQKINEISNSDYDAKRKAIFDLEMNPSLQDKESKEAIRKRKAKLEKERAETTAESLERGFASFLKELEGN